jgi:hypothetical protein
MGKESDLISNPSHYKFTKEINEVRDLINDRLENLLVSGVYPDDLLYDYANSIKYLMRWFDKNGLDDLKKANECINQMIYVIESRNVQS